jgi:hypothetical protein
MELGVLLLALPNQPPHGAVRIAVAGTPDEPVRSLPDPLAEDALIDRVIDRLDERMREQSIRHLGFTGGLTP